MLKKQATELVITLLEKDPAFRVIRGLAPNYRDLIHYLFDHQNKPSDYEWDFDNLTIVGCEVINDTEGVGIKISFCLKTGDWNPDINQPIVGFSLSPKYLHPNRSR
jgi:hypothetical protein